MFPMGIYFKQPLTSLLPRYNTNMSPLSLVCLRLRLPSPLPSGLCRDRDMDVYALRSSRLFGGRSSTWPSPVNFIGITIWREDMNKEKILQRGKVCSIWGWMCIQNGWHMVDYRHNYRGGPHPVSCIPGMFNKLFDLLDVLSYVAQGGELRGQVLHLWDLIIQSWDGFQQVLH